MLSARSCSPAEMKIFWPVIAYEPSANGVARVLRRPRSVPQCGSVKHIVPAHSPVVIFGRYRAFKSLLPCAISAATAPRVRPGYIANATFAEHSYSQNSAAKNIGRLWPPYVGSPASPTQPPSTRLLYADLNPLGVTTL